jgi:hypothetical protein
VPKPDSTQKYDVQYDDERSRENAGIEQKIRDRRPLRRRLRVSRVNSGGVSRRQAPDRASAPGRPFRTAAEPASRISWDCGSDLAGRRGASDTDDVSQVAEKPGLGEEVVHAVLYEIVVTGCATGSDHREEGPQHP